MSGGGAWEPGRSSNAYTEQPESVGTVLGTGMGVVMPLPPGDERRAGFLPNLYHAATSEYLSLSLVLIIQNLQKMYKMVANV
jgi:hypothetical protein